MASASLQATRLAALPLLAGVGFVVCASLYQDHITVLRGGVAGGLFCGAAALDCGAVAAHASSRVLGLPLPLWGMSYYVILLGVSLGAVLLRGADRKAALLFGGSLATLALIYDAWLAYVMLARIGAACPGCIATWGVNASLALLFLVAARREPARLPRVLPLPRALSRASDADYYRGLAKLGLGAVTLAFSVLIAFFAAAPLREVRAFGEEQVAEYLERVRAGVPDVAMTSFAGQPSVGPDGARFFVVAAGDFQCAQCRVIAQTLERIRAERPDELRLAFVNSPLHPECNPAIPVPVHEDACYLARAAECAHRQGRFWDLHGRLFFDTPHARVNAAAVSDDLAAFGLDEASFLACMKAGEGARAVAEDIALCAATGLSATPSIAINGFVKRGSMFPWMLEEIFEHWPESADTAASTR